MVDSDKHWARLGRMDPYLSTVKTLDPYKLDPTLGRDTAAYFESGERYLSDLFEAIKVHIAPGLEPTLGCGFRLFCGASGNSAGTPLSVSHRSGRVKRCAGRSRKKRRSSRDDQRALASE
jgi:hypothetical protein